MSLKELEKITVFGALNAKKEFLEQLQKRSIAHVTTNNPSSAIKTDMDSYIKKINAVLEFLEPQAKESFMQKNGIRPINETQFMTEQGQKLDQSLELINQLSEYLKNFYKESKNLAELLAYQKDFQPWANFDKSLEDLKKSHYVNVFMGKIQNQNLKSLDGMKDQQFLDYEVVYKQGNFQYILVFIEKSKSSNLLNLVKNAGFEEVSLSIENHIPFKERYENLTLRIESTKKFIADQHSKLMSYTTSLNQLRLISDYIHTVNETQVAYELSEKTKYLFITTLWVAKDDMEIINDLMGEFPLVSYEVAEIKENEEIPALIRNNAYNEPFEFVTEMYSLPNKRDVDPTPYYAPFFPAFMGMCISDAGSGLILMLFALFAIKKLNISASMKKLMGVCFYGGVFGIIFGILTGTYFAIPFEKFGFEVFRLYEPSHDVLFALGLSIVFGYIHVLWAFMVKFYACMIYKDIAGAFFDALTKIVLLLGGLALVVGIYYNLPTVKMVSIYVLCASIIVVWLTSGRHEGQAIYSKLLWGAYGVYELTGLFGDLLSYARLFALGLSAGIIANAINTLAPQIIANVHFDTLLHSITGILLFAVFLVVLIFGHLFIMLLGFLSAFIHTLRLQFVEFFSKFFDGGSAPFKPLSHKMKYYQIIKKDQYKKPIK